MLKNTGYTWNSPKGLRKVTEFIRDLAAFCTDPDPRAKDIITSIHYEQRASSTEGVKHAVITAMDGKKGVIIVLDRHELLPTLIEAQVSAKHENGKDAAANALSLFNAFGRITVRLDNGHYTTDKKYPCLGMLLTPGTSCSPVPLDHSLDVPANNLAVAAKFVAKYATSAGPWMEYNNTVSPRVKPAIMPFDVALDPMTSGKGIVFVAPNLDAAKIGVEAAGDMVASILRQTY